MSAPICHAYRRAARSFHRTEILSYRRQRVPHQSLRYPIRPFSASQYRPAERRSTQDDDHDDRSGIVNQGSEDVVDSDGASSEAMTATNEPEEELDNSPHFNEAFYDSLYSDEKELYSRSAPGRRRIQERVREELYEEMGADSEAGQDIEALIDSELDNAQDEMGPDLDEKPQRRARLPDDFSSMGESDRDIAPDEDWQDDDISSTAHSMLDQHREKREYARLAAWEMPLLANLAIPFVPPNKATTPLTWRYTTYLGVPHPAANKVVLTFTPADLSLTPAQTTKLIKLAGPRFDPHKNEVKMSSESFPSQAQNKRYLGDQLSALLAEAKDGEDTLEDIPLDFRHARHHKKKVRFPKEWLLTEGRKEELERKREERVGSGEVESGRVLDGLRAIESARMQEAERVAQVVAVEGAGRRASGEALKGRAR